MQISRFTLVLSLVVAISSTSVAQEAEKPSNIDEQATHEQARLIEISQPGKVQAFCLDAKGQILTAIDGDPGEIRVLSSEGEQVAAWPLEITPEAINTAPNGDVLVAGQGKLLRFTAEGKLLAQVDSPHLKAVEENRDAIRAQAAASLKQTLRPAAAMVESYTRMLEQLKEKEAKGELNDQEKKVLEILPAQLERLVEEKKQEDGRKYLSNPSEARIAEQMKALMKSKLHVASISSDGKFVYVATPSVKGYTFDVWRTNTKFGDAQVVVSDLRGCCGHMDVQACTAGLFVAENARHRVACFNAEGEPGATWGKADRTGEEGFTSCCNPMNVCFNKTGDVYTAEANTGRIKRFATDGTFIEFVGDVKLVPGCNNVSIAVSPDNDRVYMLDTTRNQIVLMQRKPAEQPPVETTADDAS